MSMGKLHKQFVLPDQELAIQTIALKDVIRNHAQQKAAQMNFTKRCVGKKSLVSPTAPPTLLLLFSEWEKEICTLNLICSTVIGNGVPNRPCIIGETVLLHWKIISQRWSGDCCAQMQTVNLGCLSEMLC